MSLKDLRFECTECGQCCTGSPDSTVTVTKEEVARIADRTGLYPGDFFKGGSLRMTPFGQLHACMFLTDTRRCSIYDVRPKQCRTFPFWPANLASEESWGQAAAKCEGIGRGEVIHEADLLSRMRGE